MHYMKWFFDNSSYFVWIGFSLFLTGISVNSDFLFVVSVIGFYFGILLEEFPYLFERKKKKVNDKKSEQENK